MNQLIANLATPPPGGPPHIRMGGVGFAFVSWAVEFKETMLAVLEPIKASKSVGEAVWIYLHLENAHYAGIAMWIAIFTVTTWVMVEMIRGLIKRPPPPPSAPAA